MHYRIYLLGPGGRIRAAEDFSAPDDTEALAIAASLHESCSDVFPDYDLWYGKRRISAGKPHWLDGDCLAEMKEWRRRTIVELEECLQSSFVRVKESRQLLERYAELRDGLAAEGMPRRHSEDGRSA